MELERTAFGNILPRVKCCALRGRQVGRPYSAKLLVERHSNELVADVYGGIGNTSPARIVRVEDCGLRFPLATLHVTGQLK